MKAIEYLKEKSKMIKNCTIDCSTCPFFASNNGKKTSCTNLEGEFPEKAIEIVKKWANEHPIKTYREDFFSRFPGRPYTSATPPICRNVLYGIADIGCIHDCVECWNEEYKED